MAPNYFKPTTYRYKRMRRSKLFRYLEAVSKNLYGQEREIEGERERKGGRERKGEREREKERGGVTTYSVNK